MKCPRCATELKMGAQFCGECGLQMNQVPQMNWAPSKEKKSTTTLIIILSIIATLLLVAIIAVVIWRNSDKDETPKSANSANVSQTSDDDSRPEETTDIQDSVADGTTETLAVTENINHTIMIYMVGSDLESGGGAATRDIKEMLSADYGEDTRIVLQTGGCSDWQLSDITDGEVQRFEIRDGELIELESLGKMHMLKADALADFITFAAEEYPADKYSLVMWDHGGGVPIGFGYDEMFPRDTLYDFQIGEALAQAGVVFDCVAFDACNMCTLEVAMSIKDYAKYMVAAESYVLGIGMDYTSWLNYLGTEDVTTLDSYEVLATTYMDSLEAYEVAGSISLINLSKIQEVYNAYIEYAKSVHTDILNGGYEEYVKARTACGLYEGTESVDIITLATTYPTSESSDLMNAVVNAVYYTESDFAYGHGLAVYNPNAKIELYEYARNNMEVLEYDSTILECYDDFVSINLAFLGTEYVDRYAGDWFDATVAYGYAEEDQEPEEYVLETVQKEGYDAIPLDEDDWDLISTVSVSVAIMLDDTSGFLLGQDFVYSTDEDGDIIIEPPQGWAFVNDNFASYVGLDYYVDEFSGEWSQTGFIFARCNGEDIVIMVYYDEEYPQGTIVGYLPYDFMTGETGTFTEFVSDDVVELVTPIINGATGEETYNNECGESYYASELILDYAEISYGDTMVLVWYEITDVYGNVYSTEYFIF